MLPNRQVRVLSVALMLAAWLTVVVYTERNGLTFPQNEGWTIVMDTARASADGTLTFGDLLRRNEVHIVFFPLLTTAINARLTDWNLLVELRVGLVLLTGTFLFIAAAYRHHNREALWYGGPLLALLLFTPLQDANLLWQFTSLQWFYQPFFFAVALWGAVVFAPSFRALAWVMVFSFASLMSSAGGLVLLPLFTLLLWMRGYGWRHYAAWLGFVGVLLYVWVTRVTVGSSADTAASGDLLIIFANWVRLIDAGFLPRVLDGVPGWYHWMLFWMVALSALYFVVARWRAGELRETFLWLALMGYGLASTLMTILGRATTEIGGPLNSRLITMALFVWLGWAGLAVDHVHARRGRLWPLRLGGWSAWVSIGLLLWVGFLGTRSTVLHVEAERRQGFVGHFTVEEGEQCYWSYFVSEGEMCVNYINKLGIGAVKGEIEELFQRGWTVYADYVGYNRAVAHVPDTFKPTDRVIVSAPQARQHVRDVVSYDLRENADVPLLPAQLLRIGGGDMPVADALNATATATLTDDSELSLAVLADFIRMTDRVWYMRGASDSDEYDRAARELLAESFTPIRIDGGRWDTTVYEDVTLYVRRANPAYWFGDDIGLEAWGLVYGSPFPCERLKLEMLWHSAADIDETYSLALVLVGEDGLPIVRHDGAPGGYMTHLWGEDSFYYARDDFDLLCEPELGGRYDLLMGLYPSGETTALPITGSAGEPLGDLLYLTTIQIADVDD